MTDIVLHQFEISPFCDKVRRVLAFKKLPYKVCNVPMGQLGKLRKLAPTGKVPILELNGQVLHDSSDICRAIEAFAPEPALFPIDPIQHALVEIIEDWADESLYFFEMTMRFTWPHDRARWVTEILKRDNAVMRRVGRLVVPYLTRKQGMQQGIARRGEADILRELGRHLASLDALLAGRNSFLLGDVLTLADIAVVAQLECVAGSTPGHAALCQKRAVTAWMERVEALTGGPAIR